MSEQPKAPQVSVNAQYIKDLSFENPLAPSSLIRTNSAPQISLSLDINIGRLEEENFFEVELSISAEAKADEAVLFILDLKYAGVFNLTNIDEEQEKLLLGVYCPSILFPFARKIVADVTQSGGFQPLMIDPIDFGALYNKKMNQN